MNVLAFDTYNGTSYITNLSRSRYDGYRFISASGADGYLRFGKIMVKMLHGMAEIKHTHVCDGVYEPELICADVHSKLPEIALENGEIKINDCHKLIFTLSSQVLKLDKKCDALASEMKKINLAVFGTKLF